MRKVPKPLPLIVTVASNPADFGVYELMTGVIKPDEFISTEDEPGHQGLCDREQAFLLRAIRDDLDLTEHMNDAVNSLRIVLAADESVRTGKTVNL